jgi:mono/diheme cytochrome c family protein
MGRVAAGLALVAALAAGIVYAWSETLLRRHSPVRAAAVAVPSDATSIAEGRRLSLVHGCLGCHGPQAEGEVLLDEPVIARIVSPNLTVSVRDHSDADLVTAIRHGVRPDGRTMIVMPSQAFAPLTDADLGRILGYLRSLPLTDGPGREVSIGPIGRLGLVLGKYKTSLQLVADAGRPPEASGTAATFGRYLARTSCAPCHGADLRGADHPEGFAPDLRIAAAYSAPDFARLMRTGVGLGGRKLGLMTPWAATYFSHFDDDEVGALYAYLNTLPAVPSK